MGYEKELQVALDAVRTAYGLTKMIRRGLLDTDILTKPDDSPVTVADLGAQAIINHAVSTAFDYPIIAEEDAGVLRQNDKLRETVVGHVKKVVSDLDESRMLDAIDLGDHDGTAGRYWILDPIDGTKGFIRGSEHQYAVALALVEGGEPVLGVLGTPVGLFIAVKGKGTTLHTSGKPLLVHVNRLEPGDDRDNLVCESFERGGGEIDRVVEILGVASPTLRLDGQTKYAAVARGRSSVFLDLSSDTAKVWDHAAGCLVVEEAGGKVTDTNGEPLDFSQGRMLEVNFGIVATNGIFHDAALDAIHQVLCQDQL